MHAGSPVGLKEVKVQNNDRIKKSTYSVSSAKTSDSGSYQCMVKRGINKSDSPLFNVTILESKAPVLNVSSEPLIIYVNETDPLSWKRMVEFYPHHPVLSYNNSRNESISSSGPRVNWTFNSTTGEAWLYIKKVQTSDFGNWTLVAEMGDLRVISRVEIIVFSSPKVQLLVPNSMNPGPVNVSCDVTSYRFVKGSNRTKQTVNISWMLADCVDQSSYCELKPLEIQSEIRASGNQIKATPVVDGSKLQYINSSVTLKCVAKTDTEEDSDEKIILVTDLADPWVFAHCRDDGSVEHFKKLESSINVVVNDNFEVWCNATDILYLPPVLSFSGDVEHKKTIFHGDYSSSSGIRLNVSKALNGTKFTCSVTHKGSNTVEVKSLEVVVEDEKPITLSASSNTKLDVIPEVYGESGTNYDIICEPEANPMPRIKWLKNEEDLQRNGTVIHFDYLKPGDAGLYKCVMTWRRKQYNASLELKIKDDKQPSYNKWALWAAGVCIFLLLVAAIVLIWRLRRERAKSKQRKELKRILFHDGKTDEINPQLMVEDQADLLPYDTSFEVPRDRIKIGRQLGSGAFGRVVKADVDLHGDQNYRPVAVKMTKSMSDASHVKSLAIELKIMIHLGKHVNIVNLIGANTQNIDKEELWLLVEYCQYGDLLSFIHRYRKKFVDQIDPVTDEINYSFMAVTPSGFASPLSPGVNNYKKRGRPSVSSGGPGPDGYLVPNSVISPIVLADPPKRHTARSSSHSSPRSPPLPSSATGSQSFFAGNPGYGVLETLVNPEPPTPASASQFPSTPPPTDIPPDAVPSSSPPPFTTPYVNVGVVQSPNEEALQSPNRDAQSSHPSPPPYVTQGFTPTKSPRRLNSISSSRSGSMSVPYRRCNSEMTTVGSSGRPFTSDVWLDSQGNPINNDGTAIPGLGHPFTTTEIICWSWQVAQGMEYLTRRKILHGDLAARNLLLAEGNIVKISDFGLSRDMYKKEIYTKQGDDLLPIKWMSIEAIRDRMFSTQSDIWAYGIVLWELFSLGMAPYPGVDVNPKFLSDLENGMRNAKPKYSNGIIYELMEDCWTAEPSDRPSFSEILARLDHLLHDDVRENFEKLNEEYDRSNQNYFAGRTDYLSMFSSPDFNNLQKAENDECRYSNMEDMTEEERQKASEYLSMRKSSYADQGEVPGYLSMKTFSEHHPSPPPPPAPAAAAAADPVDIFSPNPRDTSLPNGSRFTFHTADDLPRTKVLHSPTPSSVSSCVYTNLLQNPSATKNYPIGKKSYPESEDNGRRSDEETPEKNALLTIPEDDDAHSDDSLTTHGAKYRNFKV
ncbi:vascular endothelial growth factor receptor 1 isoform X5 [Hyalella azteca]|nr:vascular endothelial growth factor receptor 1 isoform X5 [Hyalella azteca]